VRPAPAEFPQGRKAARVGGCSGATQVAYPLFLKEKKAVESLKKRLQNKKLLFYFAPLISKKQHHVPEEIQVIV